MAMRDLPAMQSAQYASTAYGLGNLAVGNDTQGTASVMPFVGLAQQVGPAIAGGYVPMGRTDKTDQWDVFRQAQEVVNQKKETTVARRLVQVFIADPNENVPLEDSLLYSGDQKLTDATDQELFFEIDLRSILEKHNAKRVKWKVKAHNLERDIYLEPVKIRDLKMIVVTVAQF